MASTRTPVVAVCVAVGLLISQGAPALAEVGSANSRMRIDRPEASHSVAANRVAKQIASADPDSATVMRGTVSGSSVQTSVGSVKTVVDLSANPGVEVTVSTGRGDVRARITLPRGSTGAGTVADDGTAVFGGETNASTTVAGGHATAVQALTDGSTRIQTVIKDASSSHEFAYGLTGFTPALTSSGEVLFVSTDNSGAFVPVQAPWAVDARGASVPTHYEVRGTNLVQVVQAGPSTVYPVVADPTWQWRSLSYGMKLSRSETARSRDYATAVGMCVLFTKKAGAIACAVWGAYIQTQANLAESDSPKSCLFIVLIPAVGSVWRVKC